MLSEVIAQMDGVEISASEFNTAIHNAVITVFNPATGDHRTFAIKTVLKDGKFFKKDSRLAYLLIGPDRENSKNWKPFAFVGSTGILNVFRSMRGEGKKSEWEKYARILAAPTQYPTLQFLMMGYCRRCNRPLSNPESVISGTGPICGGRE